MRLPTSASEPALIEVLAIVGLPGSGKTYLAKSLMDDQTTLFDDFDKNVGRVYDFYENPTAKVILTDPHLCLVTRETAVRKIKDWFGTGNDKDISISFISFENDLNAAWANVCRRNDDRVISRNSVERLSKFYNECWDKDHPIYRP